MNKITIFTPTFNRENLLRPLYESIVQQSFRDFQWIIVDDGSTDNTAEVVDEFIRENKIEIIYKLKENAGKHTAINEGLDIANGELFFIVDSDDILPKDSLNTIWEKWEGVRDDNTFVGVAGTKGSISNQNVVGSTFEEPFIDSTVIEFRYKKRIYGDKAEVFKTSVLKKYKFPCFTGEFFATEALVWNRLSRDGYKLRWFNEIIYYCEYLEGGLTDNYDRLMVNNWNCTKLYYNELANTKEIGYIRKLISVYPYYLKYCIKKYGKFKAFYKEGNTISLMLCLPVFIIRKMKKLI